jgi:hypothetical protein
MPNWVIWLWLLTMASDAHHVTIHVDVSSSRASLAELIPLPRSFCDGSAPVSSDRDLDVAKAREAMAHRIDLLRRRYGEGWSDLPADLGRPAASAEALLVGGPTALDPVTASPLEATNGAWLLVHAAMTLGDQMVEEAEVLGEALGTDITDLPLRQVDAVVGAVLGLGLVSRAEAGWANPMTADAARVVLDAHGAQLRETTRLHDDLYASFTDRVLDIPEPRLRAGARPWRLVARTKLRRDLASASRTGRVPGGMTATARQVLKVHEARRALTSLAPLLSTHLGRGAWGHLTDVDALVASLDAVQRLERGLGDRLNHDRLSALLAADAFRSPELAVLAANLRTMLQKWRADVASSCGGDPWTTPADELADWAVVTAAALPAITAGLRAMSDMDRSPPTVQTLVDDLLLRENIGELGHRLEAWDDDHRPSASDDLRTAP